MYYAMLLIWRLEKRYYLVQHNEGVLAGLRRSGTKPNHALSCGESPTMRYRVAAVGTPGVSHNTNTDLNVFLGGKGGAGRYTLCAQ